MKWNKSVSVLISLALILAGGIAVRVVFFGRNSQGTTSGPHGVRGRGQGPVPVQTAEITYRALSDQRELTGSVLPSYSYAITAKVGGRLMSLSKRIGDRVRAAEVVGRIDDTEYRQSLQESEAQVQIARASLTEAKAQLTHAARELERTKDLLLKGISSQAEFDALQTQVQSQQSRVELAQAQLAQRQATLAQAQTRMGYTALSAAQPGLVARRHTDGGTQLSPGSPVLTIIGIDTVYVEVAVTERDYARITRGAQAQVMVDAIPGKVFSGIVARTAPQFQSSSRTAAAEIAIINDSLLLKPGMFARAVLTFAHKDSARVIPASALARRDDNQVVFVVEDSKVRMIPVTVGISDRDWVEILSPALSGTVVTLGNHLLSDGATVLTGNQSGRATNSDSRSGTSQSRQGLGR